MELIYKEILDLTDEKIFTGDLTKKITGISTDSRNIKIGNLFIPLKGEKYDGEMFLSSAIKNGASGILTREVKSIDLFKNTEAVVIYVRDTLLALHKIASYYRDKFDIPVIAVTGSSGKTTTKDMIAQILTKKYNILKTQGNFNNEIGLPLTIFQLKKDHNIAVVEMGMSGLGEIKILKGIAKPNVAVFTNIGVAHIEKLGSKENILKAKSELIEDFDDKKVIILNADDEMLIKLKGKLNSKYYDYGINNGKIRATNIRTENNFTKYDLYINNNIKTVYLSVPGIHNVYNSLAAICTGIEFNVDIDLMIDALKDYKPEKMRLNIINTDKFVIIDDAYNANPDSMKAAITVLKDLNAKRKVAVLGDMLELGHLSEEAHKEIGKYAVESGVDVILAFGANSKFIAEEAIKFGKNNKNIFYCSSKNEIYEILKNILKEGDLILVKGSRGMEMEDVVKFIQESASK